MTEIDRLVARLRRYQGPVLTFMEVCGTHTMAIARQGLKQLLPDTIRLVSGPGCPVCVTPVGYVDHALALAAREEVLLTTFGDLMRVPGSRPGSAPAPSLQQASAQGARVQVVYSPLNALQLAREHPESEVVFLGVGFETTTPTIAAAVLQAEAEGLANFSVLSAHKTIPEAMVLLSGAEDLGLAGYLCPGHVSVILGTGPYEPLAAVHGMACAVGGFEAAEVLRALVALVDQVEQGTPRVDNLYPGAVRPEGNPRARALVERVFEPADAAWRGIGVIPHSGLAFRKKYAAFDAALRFPVSLPAPVEPKGCRCGEVLRGVLDPVACPLFGRVCTPENPVGACMVSSEGSCAARYHYTLEA
ncbi:MAG: hydrogenase formation protein HypD [Deltaproteobacteria bacterium]|nr:hydrogenase formation protein HypD [Deltaproteobacteria bacterium]